MRNKEKMTTEEIVNFVQSAKKGRYVRITYSSEVPTAAAHKDVKIQKFTEKTVQFKVNYSNKKAVIERRAEMKAKGIEAQMKEMPYKSEIAHCISRNTKTNTLYIEFCPLKKNGHTKVEWYINGEKSTEEEVKKYTQPSYFNKNGEMPTFQRVKFENVISIK